MGRNGRWTTAAAAYRRALIVDPDLVPAIVNLANIRYARDELIEAQALYERAIGLDPGVLRGALQSRQHPARSRPLRSRARLLPAGGGAKPRLRRRALLPRGDAGEARALAGSEAALEDVSGPRARGEWVDLANEFLTEG